MAKAATNTKITTKSIIKNQQQTTERTKSKLHKCSKCGKGYTSKVTLMRHLDLHSKELLCQYCKKVFFSEIKRSSHIKHHHTPLSLKEKGFVCNVCNKECTSNYRLKVHMRVHTGETPYACSFCEKMFNCSSNCIRHERIHTGDRTYTCSFCDKTFRSVSHWNRHKRIHKPYACSVCQKTFRYMFSCKRHERMHNGEKLYACSRKFQQATHRKEHGRIHTEEGSYTCSLCDKTYKQLSSWKRHERIHTGYKPYACSFCKKTFNYSRNCEEHERIHTGERPYTCLLCDKTFNQFYSWKRHERIHTRERPYTCSFCQKTFRSKSSSKHHKCIYTNKPPYVCETCQETFDSLSNLQNHVSTHTKETPYKCDTGFAQLGALGSQKRQHETLNNRSPTESPASEPHPSREHLLPVEVHSSKVSYKERHMMTSTNASSVDLLSDCDRFGEDPLAGPHCDTLEAHNECEGDEIITAGDTQLDTEESFEQGDISQLKNATAVNISILSNFNGSQVNFQDVHNLLPVDVATFGREEENPDTAVGESVSDQNKNSNDSEELLIQTDETSSGQAQDSSMDSLVNSFVSVAKLHGVVLHMSVAADEEIVNLENENQSNSNVDMGNPLSPMDIAKVRQMVSEENKLKLKKAANPIKEGTDDSAIERSEQLRYSEELLIPSSNQPQSYDRDKKMDSLAKALISAAKLQGAVLHVYCLK